MPPEIPEAFETPRPESAGEKYQHLADELADLGEALDLILTPRGRDALAIVIQEVLDWKPPAWVPIALKLLRKFKE